MTNEQMDELLAEIGRAPLITCEEEMLLLKAVKEKGADSDEVKVSPIRWLIASSCHHLCKMK